jgi:hypothetical protein
MASCCAWKPNMTATTDDRSLNHCSRFKTSSSNAEILLAKATSSYPPHPRIQTTITIPAQSPILVFTLGSRIPRSPLPKRSNLGSPRRHFVAGANVAHNLLACDASQNYDRSSRPVTTHSLDSCVSSLPCESGRLGHDGNVLFKVGKRFSQLHGKGIVGLWGEGARLEVMRVMW